MFNLLNLAGLIVVLAISLAFFRCLRGPTLYDRLLGALFAGTGGAALLILMAVSGQNNSLLDAGFVLVVLAPVLTLMMIAKGLRGGDK